MSLSWQVVVFCRPTKSFPGLDFTHKLEIVPWPRAESFPCPCRCINQQLLVWLTGRLLTSFLCLPHCLICLSRIDFAWRFAWFVWSGLIRLGRFAGFAWAELIRLVGLPDLPDQDWSGLKVCLICLSRIYQAGKGCQIWLGRIDWSCSGKSGRPHILINTAQAIRKSGKQWILVISLC